jgi:predicted nucleotidyltransferase
MKIKDVEDKLLYKVIAGSKAYGLDLPTSDTDIRGIFLCDNEYRLGNGYIEQVNDNTNDIVYYDVNRFINLLSNNNPNIIENLFVPKDKILILDDRIKPLYDNRHKFLTKQIKYTFGGYAVSQIKKARGLNKKIVNPIDKERKNPLDFCYILSPIGAIELRQWLRTQRGDATKQEKYGVSKVEHARDVYYIYYDDNNLGYRGILKEDSEANELRMSSIPKSQIVKNHVMVYNQDGYQKYCKDYKEYWDWVDKRNPARYNDNIKNKHNYDGKNMMHCLRMLDMAIEIAKTGDVNLVRPDREWLLSVRKGQISYEEIMELITEKEKMMRDAFDSSSLPDSVDKEFVHNLILQIRY